MLHKVLTGHNGVWTGYIGMRAGYNGVWTGFDGVHDERYCSQPSRPQLILIFVWCSWYLGLV